MSKTKSFDAFIFDFDLTLADSSKGILKCFKHTLSEFGYDIPDDNTIYNTIGLTVEQAFGVLADVYDTQKHEEMRKVYVKKADEVMAKDTVFYDGTIDALKKLKSHNIKTAIVSTKYRYRIIETFKAHGYEPQVDLIIGGEDVKEHKPDPTGLLTAIERLGVEKKNTIYVGDSYIDAETAKNAGVNFAAVTSGSTTMSDFSKYPHLCISSYAGMVVDTFVI